MSGGELTVGLVSAVGRFDPHGWSGFTSNVVTNHVYQGLVRLNFDTSEIEPCLGRVVGARRPADVPLHAP